MPIRLGIILLSRNDFSCFAANSVLMSPGGFTHPCGTKPGEQADIWKSALPYLWGGRKFALGCPTPFAPSSWCSHRNFWHRGCVHRTGPDGRTCRKGRGKNRIFWALPQVPELPSVLEQRGLHLEPWLGRQEADYKLLQSWSGAGMGGLLPPSVLLIDNLPSKATAA